MSLVGGVIFDRSILFSDTNERRLVPPSTLLLRKLRLSNIPIVISLSLPLAVLRFPLPIVLNLSLSSALAGDFLWTRPFSSRGSSFSSFMICAICFRCLMVTFVIYVACCCYCFESYVLNLSLLMFVFFG